ncbi:14771_t:CDS:2, partial [Acaulospora colombiana]
FTCVSYNRTDIFGRHFGWKKEDVCTAIEGEDISANTSTNFKDWSSEQVTSFLRSKKDEVGLDEKYITKIQEQETNGFAFLLLTEEILTRKSGPFEFPYGPAVAITNLVNKFREEGKAMFRSSKHETDVIENAIEYTRQIESLLRILMMKKPALCLGLKLLKSLKKDLPVEQVVVAVINGYVEREKGLIAWLLQNRD